MASKTAAASAARVVFVMGCTGTGKSNLGIHLAEAFNGEIVNADSMQVYNALPIATNRMSLDEQKGVPHHLLGSVAPTNVYTVGQFVSEAVPIIDDISKRGRVPIIVGGTGYYIHALLHASFVDEGRLSGDSSTINKDAAIAKKIASLDNDEVYKRLESVDPTMARRLHPNDTRKVRRSLEVYEQHGVPHSELLLQFDQKAAIADHSSSDAEGMANLRFAGACCLWIECEQDVLDTRLDKRVDSMMKMGLLNEHVAFRQDFEKLRPPALLSDAENADSELDFNKGVLQAIGFKEFQPPYSSENDDRVKEAVDRIKQRTRRYSRKQNSWMKHKLMTGPETLNMYVYKVNGTDLTSWNTNVLDRASALVTSFLNGVPEKSLPRTTQPSVGVRLSTWQKFSCEDCDKVLNGEEEWNAHIRSRRHKKRKQSNRRNEERKKQNVKSFQDENSQ
eukprot:m.8353 g.8353  ORF g.8353 m.8353 type:complete len:448 (+) comp3873_c0_seq2:218-1561(+)